MDRLGYSGTLGNGGWSVDLARDGEMAGNGSTRVAAKWLANCRWQPSKLTNLPAIARLVHC